MINNEDFNCLEVDGYMVVRNVVSAEVISKLKEDFNKFRARSLEHGFANKNYQIIHGDHLSAKIAKDAVLSTLASIRKNTSVTADVISQTATYFDMSLQAVRWHQDHDPYYMWQDVYNSINFWIPIEKEHADQSGITVLPYSVLRKHRPDLADKFEKSGARDFLCWEGQTKVTDDTNDEVYMLDFDFDKFGVVPKLLPGDMLIMRNDLIHKTQSFKGKRIAVSIRCFPKHGTITKEFLLAKSREKTSRMLKFPEPYKRILATFKDTSSNITELGKVFNYIE